jgi:Mitochondrial domain of unknown function (DUF1713)
VRGFAAKHALGCGGRSQQKSRPDSSLMVRLSADSHPPVMAGNMRELSGDKRRQVIKSGTTVLSREREVAKVGSVIKKRRKRMAKKKHRKLLKRTRIQRRRAGK